MSLRKYFTVNRYTSAPVKWLTGAAALWAFAFAAISAYWALGGHLGRSSLGEAVHTYSSDPNFIWFVWGTVLLKLLAVVVALALRYGFVGRLNSLVLFAGFTAGGICLLYGGANLAVRAAMALGFMHTPASMYEPAAFWHLVLWDPWWVLGGVLFLASSISTLKQKQAGGITFRQIHTRL